MMMSGPAPVFAVTAVCGRMSSQLTKSTRTGMPVCSVNFLVFSRNSTSSGSTNLAGRSTRRRGAGFDLEAGRLHVGRGNIKIGRPGADQRQRRARRSAQWRRTEAFRDELSQPFSFLPFTDGH